METGRVKWFDTQKGYGFIVTKDNSDLFVYHKNVQGEIKENDEVEYEVAQGTKGPHAVKVRKI